MKHKIWLLFIFGFFFTGLAQAQIYRKEFNIPDIDGFKTLKCDFHIHTVFSDGYVWPTVRVQEAWMEGLDAIAFTDHLEYRPFIQDITSDHNRAFEIAEELGARSDLIVIKGAEITRKKPMGHLNAIFTTDNNELEVKDSVLALNRAMQQGAFVFWNHPSNKYGKWSQIQDMFYKNKLFQGIEVVNSNTYYPDAQKWCIDKNLTMIGTSDIHNPITFNYDLGNNGHRAMTLVFARERSRESIKEALVNHRTAVCWNNKLIGKEEFLKPIFQKSISINDIKFVKNNKGTYAGILFIKNNSDLLFNLKMSGQPEGISLPENITVNPGSTLSVPFDYQNKAGGSVKIEVPLEVSNFLVGPDLPMFLSILLNINIE